MGKKNHVTVDERLFDDKRYFDLIARVGDAPKALGALVIAWKLAKKCWARKGKKIPIDEWEKIPNAVDIAAVGLAEIEDGLVYLKGSDELFSKRAKEKTPALSSSDAWRAYTDNYNARYGADPVRNAMVNTQMLAFVKRVGLEEARYIAEFYLSHNDSYYVKSMHSVGLLLRDAEKLRTEWKTGNKVLGSRAKEVERQQHNADSWEQAARILNDRRKK